VKLVVAARAPVDWLPLVARLPLHPSDAVQVVALVELQVSVDEPPEFTLMGLAEIDTVGAGGAVTVTVAVRAVLPPAPVQVSV
jgi:hypothetical protein